MRYEMKTYAAVLAGALCLVLVPARAENYAVVRTIQGAGSVQGSGDEQPQALALNIPLMEGDNAWTGDGQMDLVLQDGNHVWVDANTRFEVDQLPTDSPDEPRSLRLRLWKGSILLDMRVWGPGMEKYVVATPSASAGPGETGLYLIEVENVDRTRVTCLNGRCFVASAGSTVALGESQMTYADYGYAPLAPLAVNKVSSSLLTYRDANLPRRTSGRSARYLPDNLTAYADDLDSYGDWNYTADYGYVWQPTVVVADWAPYTYGRWGWEPWGTTWISYDPWGWAPFHYGRWIYGAGFGWGWCPMPYFAPAWVSWWWDGGGWLGWCPMGYYGSPLWGPSGWWSCGVGNIYNYNLGNHLVHHRTSPPPNPIYPRAPGSPGVESPRGGPRGSGTSINLPPARVREFREGRLTAGALGSTLREPIRSDRRAYPSVQPSTVDSSGRAEPSRREPSAARVPRSTAGTAAPQPSDTTRSRVDGTGSRQPATSTTGVRSFQGDSTGIREVNRGAGTTTPRTAVEPAAPAQPRTSMRTPVDRVPTDRPSTRAPVTPPSGSYTSRETTRTSREPVAPAYRETSRAPVRESRPSYQQAPSGSYSIPSRPPSGASAPSRSYSTPSSPSPSYSRPSSPSPSVSRPSSPAPSSSRPSSPPASSSSGGSRRSR